MRFLSSFSHPLLEDASANGFSAIPDSVKEYIIEKWGGDYKKLTEEISHLKAHAEAYILSEAPYFQPPTQQELARIKKETGSNFNPKSKMDIYNLSLMRAGKPTVNAQQYKAAIAQPQQAPTQPIAGQQMTTADMQAFQRAYGVPFNANDPTHVQQMNYLWQGDYDAGQNKGAVNPAAYAAWQQGQAADKALAGAPVPQIPPPSVAQIPASYGATAPTTPAPTQYANYDRVKAEQQAGAAQMAQQAQQPVPFNAWTANRNDKGELVDDQGRPMASNVTPPQQQQVAKTESVDEEWTKVTASWRSVPLNEG